MVESSIAQNAERTRSMLVIGGIGAGKSTTLNILNSQGLGEERKEFIASNQLRGCTQDFIPEIMLFPNVGLVQLIDSPGLSDPNIPIDVWVQKYNNQIHKQDFKLDLVVCVIEYATRPSSKEYQVFTVMNQALAAIKAENLIVIFNKCPEETEQDDAVEYYNTCRSQIQKDDLKLPDLKDENFLVLQKKGNIKRKSTGEELKKAQMEVNNLLTDDVCKFVFTNLVKVKAQIKPNEADRKKIVDSCMDQSTKDDIAQQKKDFDAQIAEFQKQINKGNETITNLRADMKANEKKWKDEIFLLNKQITDAADAHKTEIDLLKEEHKTGMENLNKQLDAQKSQFDIDKGKLEDQIKANQEEYKIDKQNLNNQISKQSQKHENDLIKIQKEQEKQEKKHKEDLKIADDKHTKQMAEIKKKQEKDMKEFKQIQDKRLKELEDQHQAREKGNGGIPWWGWVGGPATLAVYGIKKALE